MLKINRKEVVVLEFDRRSPEFDVLFKLISMPMEIMRQGGYSEEQIHASERIHALLIKV